MDTTCENCIVHKINALKVLNKEQLIELNSLKVSKSYNRDEILFKEGSRVNGIYCILSGVIKLSKQAENGREQIVKFVTRGDMIGHRSIISDQPASLTAVALDQVSTCFIPLSIINKSIRQNPEFVQELLKQIAIDLKNANDKLADMSQKTVKQRLAQVLLYFHNRFGVDPQTGYLALVVSRDDLAATIGTATESCIRLLSDLRKSGCISTHNKSIKLENIKQLEQLVND